MPAPAWIAAGTVVALEVLWPPGAVPRTVVTLALDPATAASLPRDLPGRRGDVLPFVVPGANGDLAAVAWGVPTLGIGERWKVDLVEGRAGLTPSGLGEGMRDLSGGTPWPFTLSGVHYEDFQLPRTFWMESAGSDDIGADGTEEAILSSLAQWNGVGCSAFAFEYGGRTETGVDLDGVNVLAWENETWEWDPAVAGLTLTQFGDVGGQILPVEADIVFNGASWTWSPGPGDAYASPPTLHAGSVIVHELGHVAGLGHVTDDPAATMFFAYVGGDWQGTTSGDDRRGLCENYPSGQDECGGDRDCDDVDGTPRFCAEIDGVSVCDEVRDPVGAACSRTHINCDGYCVFTNLLATEGYCTVACPDGTCPAGYGCGEEDDKLPQDESPVCLEGEDPGDDDSGPGDDDAAADDDSAAGEPPEGCACGGSGAAGALALPWLAWAGTGSRRGRTG